MTTARKRLLQKRAEVQVRQDQIAIRLLAGMDYRQIASVLGVSVSTVARDVSTIVRQWGAAIAEEIETRRALELRRLDEMWRAVWPKAIKGDLRAIAAALDIQKRRMQLLGLDIQRTDLTSGGKPLPAAQVQTVIQLTADEVSTSLEVFHAIMDARKRTGSNEIQ